MSGSPKRVLAFLIGLFFLIFPALAASQALEHTAGEEFLIRMGKLEDRLTRIEKDNEEISQMQERILAKVDEVRVSSRRVAEQP